MSSIEPSGIQPEAIEMINSLPEGATWDDLMYKIYVRQCIEAGISDAEAGRVVDVDEVRRRFGLNR